ncbi:MAG TPA: prenyltransferase/squalene oxidase repeat-containing protein [Pirellulales bacterium]|jgi:hypothetical protein|nr:prenyltransferase/squalene oxidase repeat-containing protein [Pirellulales bacterium]
MGPLDRDADGARRLPPIPVGSGGPAGSSAGPLTPGSNRPIPLQPRAANQVPDIRDDADDEETVDEIAIILRHAPAWLVSTVFHMLLLVVLGLLAVSVKTAAIDPEIELGGAEEEPSFGTQMEDPSILQGDSSHIEGVGDEQMITPTDLAPVDDPLASPVEIGDLKIGPGVGPMQGSATIEGAPPGLALKGRQIGSRNVLLGKYGGTSVTEAAVANGLAWLAKQQRTDGLWSLTGPYGDGSRNGENTVAATAMALIAFQGHGDTYRDGQYARTVAKGWNALLKLQRKDGLFSGTMSSRNELLYAHGQASIAVCELYGMTQDSTYRGPAERAIAYAVSVQDKKYGGWRYTPGEDSDTSVTGWFVMALQSARMAGLKVPEETLDRVTKYLDLAQTDGGRRYGYWLAQQGTAAVSAEGLLCRQYLGWKQDDTRLVEGVSALNNTPITYMDANEPPPDTRIEQDVYYWYYATQATHHMEGKIWDEWNRVMRDKVPAHQVKTGPESGSWNPNSDKWGTAGGRLYVTCLSIYMLEVYYRHLPIYSGYRAFDNIPKPLPSSEPEEKKPEETADAAKAAAKSSDKAQAADDDADAKL